MTDVTPKGAQVDRLIAAFEERNQQVRQAISDARESQAISRIDLTGPIDDLVAARGRLQYAIDALWAAPDDTDWRPLLDEAERAEVHLLETMRTLRQQSETVRMATRPRR